MAIDWTSLYLNQLGGSSVSGTRIVSENQPATVWWKIVLGVIIIAVLIDVQPKLGGWLLLLLTLGLALKYLSKSTS